ncbi:DUF3592 domain-containing protein [Streptomyces sp. NPDC059917]|uniref:DUF3592 domain-containing protein n=1 Tax=Streptomyces sp. NPDC059917 TaxID=3347002 RepID=UPI0036666F8B
MERAWLFSLIPLVLGTVFLAFGTYGLRRTAALRRTGVTTTARIVHHAVRTGDEGARYHFPVAAWTTADGRACAYESRFGRGSVGPGAAVGATVLVRYDPRDPSRFTIQGWEGKGVDLLFAGLGALLTTGTLVAVLVRFLTLPG